MDQFSDVFNAEKENKEKEAICHFGVWDLLFSQNLPLHGLNNQVILKLIGPLNNDENNQGNALIQ